MKRKDSEDSMRMMGGEGGGSETERERRRVTKERKMGRRTVARHLQRALNE